VVSAVRDFGLEAIPADAASSFAQDMADALPGVPTAAWAAHRHVPVTADMLGLPPADGVVTPRMAVQFMHSQRNDSALYQSSTVPVLVVPAAELTAALHNLPPDSEPMEDLVLNLANVLYWVRRGSAYETFVM
jgi:hypothetical protein